MVVRSIALSVFAAVVMLGLGVFSSRWYLLGVPWCGALAWFSYHVTRIRASERAARQARQAHEHNVTQLKPRRPSE